MEVGVGSDRTANAISIYECVEKWLVGWAKHYTKQIAGYIEVDRFCFILFQIVVIAKVIIITTRTAVTKVLP